jgi:hypothetical protein
MNRDPHPIRTTLLVGGLGALAWLLADLALGWQASRPLWAFVLWLLTVLYACLLASWSGRGWTAVLFPLAVLGLWGWQRPYAGDTVVVALAILSWVRSGVCFPGAPVPAILREAAICGGGGLLAAALIPDRALSWAVGIWLFFLVQALFFVFFEADADRRREKTEIDPFERALRRAEKILERG